MVMYLAQVKTSVNKTLSLSQAGTLYVEDRSEELPKPALLCHKDRLFCAWKPPILMQLLRPAWLLIHSVSLSVLSPCLVDVIRGNVHLEVAALRSTTLMPVILPGPSLNGLATEGTFVRLAVVLQHLQG